MTGGAHGAVVAVRLLQLPIGPWEAAREHVDGLLREFTLLTATKASADHGGAPRRLLALVAELRRDYGALGAGQEDALVAAASAGRAAVDLTYHVPVSAADACRRLAEALDVADDYCRAGTHLLSLAAPPQAVALRRWFLDEFPAQIGGRPPVPWPASDHARRLAASTGRTGR